MTNPPTTDFPLPPSKHWGLHTLKNTAGLTAEITPGGTLHALRHGAILINQFLPSPAEDGLFRLLVRWRQGGAPHWAPLAGPGPALGPVDSTSAQWTTTPAPGLDCTTTLTLHPRETAWAWLVLIRNTGARHRTLDVLHAQDLGLAAETSVRTNEAYTSQYIDMRTAVAPGLGPVILARQNQATGDDKFPWLALACATGASAYSTDAWQFFGADHRFTGEPAAVRATALPSTPRQHECALAALQSHAFELAPGAQAQVVFVARFLENHPGVSTDADLAIIRSLFPTDWLRSPARNNAPQQPLSLLITAPLQHGDKPAAADWSRWFPGPRRNIERDSSGAPLSFFHAQDTHVVSREKEIASARPHGHLLRSGDGTWIDTSQFGVTCYAAGVFRAHAYFGNPNFGRLLPPLRNPLNLVRAAGERIFARIDGAWRQLGIPTAFAMTPGAVRWLYRIGPRTLETRVWCSPTLPASCLEIRVLEGAPLEFLLAYTLSLGPFEYEHGGSMRVHARESWAELAPAPESLLARHMPGAGFTIATRAPDPAVQFSDDRTLYPGGQTSHAPCATLLTPATVKFGVILAAGPASELPALIASARAELTAGAPPAHMPEPPVRLSHDNNTAVARIDEILPWFSHNAATHFSAPRGLEQYGGAAWGVRDVCQGSLEWMLARCDIDNPRRMLLSVFAQQNAQNGDWPQWFMHPPFEIYRQERSHGDACFWPVKALCDYIEASNDFTILDAQSHPALGTILQQCDRFLALCESRFAPGTALVNYGDGDWDDTLQPADPALRTLMVSAWTVALSFHTFHQLAVVCRKSGHDARASHLDSLLARIRDDFCSKLMPDGIVAGFLINEPKAPRMLLHPRDTVTGIRYRLLPMTRAILAELFTPEQARSHLDLIRRELLFPDGARLMNEPVPYHGGRERWFKRAETAASFGREIGLQYVHAHIRYAEALAKAGDASAFWRALQVVNPVCLVETVPNATPRQANVYFTSSDADFDTRYDASLHWGEVRKGTIPVRGGWRLYSSGPGMYVHKIRTCLLGLRESFGDIVIDPVMPRDLDGLTARATLRGRPVEMHYRIKNAPHSPASITINGARIDDATRDENPYRTGGLRIPAARLDALLSPAGENRIVVEL